MDLKCLKPCYNPLYDMAGWGNFLSADVFIEIYS